jgi:hypothetical protein
VSKGHLKGRASAELRWFARWGLAREPERFF